MDSCGAMEDRTASRHLQAVLACNFGRTRTGNSALSHPTTDRLNRPPLYYLLAYLPIPGISWGCSVIDDLAPSPWATSSIRWFSPTDLIRENDAPGANQLSELYFALWY